MSKIIITNTFKSWLLDRNQVASGYGKLLQRLKELEKTQDIVIMQFSDDEYQLVEQYCNIKSITRKG